MRTCWAVTYSNCEPPEVDSLWATEELANQRAREAGHPWNVKQMTINESGNPAKPESQTESDKNDKMKNHTQEVVEVVAGGGIEPPTQGFSVLSGHNSITSNERNDPISQHVTKSPTNLPKDTFSKT